LEAVYQEALAIELRKQDVPFVREKPLTNYYSGVQLGTRYDADFLCYDSVILELKAVSDLSSKHFAQVINYLKATGLERGLLVNFGASRLEYKRVAFTGGRKNLSADVADVRR
jgi:GxxExxY protein